MRSLRTIAATHGHYQPDDFAAPLQTRPGKSARNKVGQQRIARNHDICARNQYRQQPRCPRRKELFECVQVCWLQNRESRQGRPLRTVERWRNSPNTAASGPELLLFQIRIFDQAIGRIGHHCVQRVRGLTLEPGKAVIPDQGRLPESKGTRRSLRGSWRRFVRESFEDVLGSIHSRKQCGCIELQIGPHRRRRNCADHGGDLLGNLGNRSAMGARFEHPHDGVAYFSRAFSNHGSMCKGMLQANRLTSRRQ